MSEQKREAYYAHVSEAIDLLRTIQFNTALKESKKALKTAQNVEERAVAHLMITTAETQDVGRINQIMGILNGGSIS